MTRSVAWEGMRFGIKANALAPAAFDTRLYEVFTPDSDAALIGRPPELEISLDSAEYVALLTASRVTPMALALAHRSCPATSQIFNATGGYYCRYAISHTEGVCFPYPTVEDVVANWDRIRDDSLPNELDGEAMVVGRQDERGPNECACRATSDGGISEWLTHCASSSGRQAASDPLRCVPSRRIPAWNWSGCGFIRRTRTGATRRTRRHRTDGADRRQRRAGLDRLRPGCVVYAASGPERDGAAVPDYVSLLEAGINVVTTTVNRLIHPPSFEPEVWRDPADPGGCRRGRLALRHRYRTRFRR